jgi:hypothetical protein
VQTKPGFFYVYSEGVPVFGWFGKAQNLLLFDGFGACLTFLMNWFLLASGLLQTGLPVFLLESMAVAALCFAVFDFSALVVSWNPTRSLRVIAFLNVSYCLFVLVAIFFHRSSVSLLGFSYFFVELIVVALLARWEWSVATRR